MSRRTIGALVAGALAAVLAVLWLRASADPVGPISADPAETLLVVGADGPFDWLPTDVLTNDSDHRVTVTGVDVTTTKDAPGPMQVDDVFVVSVPHRAVSQGGILDETDLVGPIRVHYTFRGHSYTATFRASLAVCIDALIPAGSSCADVPGA